MALTSKMMMTTLSKQKLLIIRVARFLLNNELKKYINMRKIIAILIFPILFSSCIDGLLPNKGKEGKVDLNIKAFYDTENLVLGNFYDYPDSVGSKIKFNTLIFFISDIQLADDLSISEAILWDFSKNHSSAMTAPNGEKYSIKNVPVGDYEKIEFGVGVNAALNATNPADYASDEALSNTSMYWDWRGSYIFAMVEGELDTNGDGQGDVPFLYHMGSDAMFKDASFSDAITVEKNGTTTINLKLNAKDIFVVNNQAFDIEAAQSSHTGVDDEEIANMIMTNLANAIKLE
jgi:hypothetical protein